MERRSSKQTTAAMEAFRAYIRTSGLKTSRQRDSIAEVFLARGGHAKVEELVEEVRRVDPRVSLATVYRTMKLLADCGLAEVRHFADGVTRYEIRQGDAQHHDHLICTKCGTIVEFVEPRIEKLQELVAEREKFVVTHHKLELYGLCAGCRSA